jgi:hypothetical protein
MNAESEGIEKIEECGGRMIYQLRDALSLIGVGWRLVATQQFETSKKIKKR